MTMSARAGTQSRWLDLIRRWQRSKLSVREFCQRYQLREPSFYSWRRVLRERGLLDEQTPGDEPGTPTFVKLSLGAETTVPSAIELVVGPRVLRLRPGFDPAMLLELVRLLEERAC